MNKPDELHLLNGYFHNVISLLKFIKEDNHINDEEILEMLDLALVQESKIVSALEILKKKELDGGN